MLAAPLAEDGNQVVVAVAAAVQKPEVEVDPMHMPVVPLVLPLPLVVAPLLPLLDAAALLRVAAELDTPGTVAGHMPVAGRTPDSAVWQL